MLKYIYHHSKKGGIVLKKKILLLFTMIVLVLGVSSCSEKNNVDSSSTTGDYESKATIELVEDGEKFKEETLEFNEDEKLLDIMKRNLDIVEKDGFIESIEKKSQDPDKNKYWLYEVNGEMAQVGANEYKLKDGDKVLFRLEELKNE